EGGGTRAGGGAGVAGAGPVPAWPARGAIPPGLARPPAGPTDGRLAPGLLDATLPWTTLAGLGDRPGTLGRIGPVTAAQARLLARAAQADPAAQWRGVVPPTRGPAPPAAPPPPPPPPRPG